MENEQPNVTYPFNHELPKSKWSINPKYMKAIRIFLLILIVIGIGLLITQKSWVPILVDKILKYENITIFPIPEVTDQFADWQTYRSNAFGFSLHYNVSQHSPTIVTDTSSIISYDPVAEDQFSIYLFSDPTKFHSKNYNDDNYDDVTYLPNTSQWFINSGSKTPLCPVERFDSQGVLYYQISTGFHAGSYVNVYITDKGIVALAGAVYHHYDGKFHDDIISFDNPKSVLKATCSIVKIHN